MAYMRDSDRHTRGVGAIAAADHIASRQRQRVQIGRATRARDQAMSRIARGSLGRVNIAAESAEGETYAPAPIYTAPPAAAPPSMWHPPPDPMPPTPAPTSWPLPGTVPAPAPVRSPPFAPPPSATGAGTVGVTMGLPPSTIAIDPIPILPSEPDPTGPDNTMRTVLIVGGAALAAYLLFGRGGS
jgi:hypothetical protein